MISLSAISFLKIKTSSIISEEILYDTTRRKLAKGNFPLHGYQGDHSSHTLPDRIIGMMITEKALAMMIIEMTPATMIAEMTLAIGLLTKMSIIAVMVLNTDIIIIAISAKHMTIKPEQ